MTNLSKAPEYVEWFAENGELGDERVVGFFAETKADPTDPGRVIPDLWVVVTTGGLYYLDVESRLCVRARTVHHFESECGAIVDDRQYLSCNRPDGHDGTHMKIGSGHIGHN